MLTAFEKRKYPINGKIVELKFRKVFSHKFDSALSIYNNDWTQAKQISDILLDEKNIGNKAEYKKNIKIFRQLNANLIKDSDYITKICREEADFKSELSKYLQIGAFIFVLITFTLLVRILRINIHKPIYQIKDVFTKMGNGDFNVSLNRVQNDEFKSLFDDFNRFIANYKIIKDIENKILEEDGLSGILNFMKSSFDKFIKISNISLYYKNALEQNIKYEQNSHSEILNADIKIYESITKEDEFTLILPIIINDTYLGYAKIISLDKLNERNMKFIENLKGKINLAFYKSLLFKDLLAIVTNGLSDLAEARDPETKKHLIRMSYYTQVIAKQLKNDDEFKTIVDDDFIHNIKLVAPMHDIGKVSVPDSILLKAGKLSDEEFEVMKKHAYDGAIVLRNIHNNFSKYGLDYFDMAREIANYHQEKYDGSGYPDKIRGNDIPLSARISAVADVFDALTSKRPYKEAFSLEKSYEILKESSGTHFDPLVIDAFFKAIDQIESIYNEHKEV